VGLWRFNTRIGPCSGTEHKHQHPFWAGSSSARVFTVADFLVRISAGLGRVFAALESADVLMVNQGSTDWPGQPGTF
jgi:hypothetical protein